ncbi:sulfur oxidation c-type cytochrome SoxX [Salipiger sp. PrR002]|uniref:sulfur oxidation c-type cytochrome SoxX n=1 Tax=Salipiger sp. PrR002 TaxID=2706489 RepID=UPI0013B5FB22|nr:sulfur oxidation c-type cytochrome SoxX [Salipiger sp. PrR002]NDV98030.1 sulfur oxidation c-type cytochrome SoxX [Salipiger sp. PrR002]NDW57005.1 sulfur oxidation c-type cytochrome SoxX [Salipiger sp. PrR004]
MKTTVAIASVIGIVASAALADPTAPADVSFTDYGEIESSLTGTPGDPANGAVVMTTRSKGNCVACHEITALNDAPFHGEVGPVLDGVGGYRSEAELRGIVANAKKMFEGTVMPAFYKSSGFIRPGDGYTGKAAQGDLPPILSAQEIEDVVAFLMTLQDS